MNKLGNRSICLTSGVRCHLQYKISGRQHLLFLRPIRIGLGYLGRIQYKQLYPISAFKSPLTS